jgi:hypothetical protein
MKKYLLLIALFFVGCTPSSLKLTYSDELLLQHNLVKYNFATKVQKRELTHFLNLDVVRYELQNKSQEGLYFEEVTSDINYEFKYGSIKTISDIFDVSRYHTLYYSGGLLLIQLEVEPKKYVNLLAETSSTQEMSYVYGFSNSEFRALIKSLGVDVDSSKLKKGYRVKESLSFWNQGHLILFPLVKPMFRRGMF